MGNRGGLKRENRQIGMFLKKIKKAHFREFSAFAPKSMKSADFLVVDSKYSSFLYVHFQRNLCSPRLLKNAPLCNWAKIFVLLHMRNFNFWPKYAFWQYFLFAHTKMKIHLTTLVFNIKCKLLKSTNTR